MAKNRRIPNIRNILRHSRINWRVIARTDFPIRYLPIFVFSKNLEVRRIWYLPIFVFSKNLEVPRIYSIRHIMTNTENIRIHWSAHYLFTYSRSMFSAIPREFIDVWFHLNAIILSYLRHFCLARKCTYLRLIDRILLRGKIIDDWKFQK